MSNDLIKNYDIDLSSCSNLTLISSESCNLNCAYCVMAKSANKEHQFKETEKIKESFNSGKFLDNLKIISKKHNLDPLKITYLDVWGQEPTLTLNEFSNAFEDIYTFFPNLKTFYFSTNAVAFPERIINLAKHIDEVVTGPFNFDFQFSYDGYYETIKSRGIQPEIIKNNIEKVIVELNKIEFNHLRMEISFHNVFSAEMINKFGGSDEYDEEFHNYLKELSDLTTYFSLLNKKSNIHVGEEFVPGIEVPYNASAEEGKNLTNFIQKAYKIGYDIQRQWWKNVLYKYNEHLIIDKANCNSLDTIAFLSSTLASQDTEYIKLLSSGTGCGSNYHNLKVRYDGTMVHCQNAITMLNPELYKDKTDLNYDIHRELIKHNYYPNLLNDNELLEVKKAFLKGEMIKTSSFPFLVSEVLNLMLLLLDCGQIDESYKNNQRKLFSHAIRLSQMFICWDNNLNTTGSCLGKLAGELRFYCNGYLDLVDKIQDEYLAIRKARNNDKYSNE